MQLPQLAWELFDPPITVQLVSPITETDLTSFCRTSSAHDDVTELFFLIALWIILIGSTTIENSSKEPNSALFSDIHIVYFQVSCFNQLYAARPLRWLRLIVINGSLQQGASAIEIVLFQLSITVERIIIIHRQINAMEYCKMIWNLKKCNLPSQAQINTRLARVPADQ